MKNIGDALGVLVVAAIAYGLFFALPIMWLWNYCLVGTIDGIHEITFVKALGLLVMIGLATHKPDNFKSEDKE